MVTRSNTPGEDDLVRRIQRLFPSPSSRVRVPIGDDAAVVRPPAGQDLVLTTDQMVEGHHFRRVTHPPELLGARALTINLSDIHAMGARPAWFLLSLHLPRAVPASYLDGVLRGLARQARRHGVSLVGGNLTASEKLVLDLTLAGNLQRGTRPLRRSGARVGDALYVSGKLGGAALGLALLTAGWRWRQGKAFRRGSPAHLAAAATPALRAHLIPAPDFDLAPLLVRHRIATAGMDLSDGLSTDLRRLCLASGVGARIEAARLPLHHSLSRFGTPRRALALALHGGEDYQLLFTVPPAREAELRERVGARKVRRIGVITPAAHGVLLREKAGEERALHSAGYDHLRGPTRSIRNSGS